ncbi:MAG: V-type ATP synthase subunit K [Phycisphaerae bacterium]|nr:V-type ATP synthase subunit K [Phycisphaerae bacterium]
MDSLFLGQLGMIVAVGMGATGSSLGAWTAGQAAAGAWARDSKAGRPISFSYILFIAAPLSQTLYALIVMLQMAELLKAGPAMVAANGGQLLGIGITAGLAELFSAWGQGAIGAAACRSLSESEGKGFAFLVIAIGIIEAVGMFTMVFMLGMVPKA